MDSPVSEEAFDTILSSAGIYLIFATSVGFALLIVGILLWKRNYFLQSDRQ